MQLLITTCWPRAKNFRTLSMHIKKQPVLKRLQMPLPHKVEYHPKRLRRLDRLIKQEERETGDIGLKPFIQYLKQKNGFFYFSTAVLLHLIFVISQIAQNSWMAANVDNPDVSTLRLIAVYLLIGFSATFILLFRTLATVVLGLEASKSLFSQLLNSLFRAPMSFYDSTPLGRILSRVGISKRVWS